MNVLVFGITENPGGVESVIMNYFRHIDPKNVHLDFLCNTKEVAYEDELLKRGSKVFRIPMRSQDRKAYKKELKKFFDTYGKDYDALWVNVCSLANIDYLKEAKRVNIPTRIIHSHNSMNMDSKLRGLLHQFNKKQVQKYATDYWACTQAAADWFFEPSLQKSDHFKLINNAIDVSAYLYDPKIRNKKREELDWQNKWVIGNVGRLHFQKNQKFLIEAFSYIAKKYPEALLVLVGQGEDEKMLKEKVQELNLENQVQFLGVRSDIPSLLQAMDVFAFPSVFEGLGLALLEAQAASLPVLAAKEGIPLDSKITENFEYIPLAKGPKYWAEKMEELKGKNRKIISKEEFAASGYEIETEAKKMEQFFLNHK